MCEEREEERERRRERGKRGAAARCSFTDIPSAARDLYINILMYDSFVIGRPEIRIEEPPTWMDSKIIPTPKSLP